MTNLSKDDIQKIVFETVAEISNDYIVIKEELRKMRTGESVVIPADMDHTRLMMHVAQFYISQNHHHLMDTIKG